MKRWTEEDLNPYIGVAAVVKGSKPGHVLMQKHVKLRKWTIPVGKAKLEEDPQEALKRELKEETGITATKMNLIHHGIDSYPVLRGRPHIKIPVYVYEVVSYEGTPSNLEPTKHSEQDFMNPQKLVLDGEPISVATRHWLAHKRKNK